MGAIRSSLVSLLEWAVAVSLVVVLLAGVVALQRAIGGDAALADRQSPPPAAPRSAHIPERAIAVPLLILPDGNEVRLGESMADVAARLGRSAETGKQFVETTGTGEQVIRFYEHADTAFILVFDSDGGSGGDVAGIYLQ